MALRLVNTAPGESTDAVKPGQFAQFGFKSELSKISLSSLAISMGLTNVSHHGVLPEVDPSLPPLDVSVTLETSEHRRPVDGTTPISISSGSLVFAKSNTLDGELGIYEVKMPIKERASCLASFKFKTKTAWTAFSADWCNLSNMIGMYFGLEHGTFNTAAYAFLRGNSVSGSMVVGGPLQSYSTARPGQVEVLPGAPHAATPGFAWKSLPNDSIVELFIFFNVEGYQNAPLTGVPTNVPLVEIWTKSPSDAGPVVQAYIPVGALDEFPSSLVQNPFTNSRPGTSNTATIFFGNIARTGGSDVLELIDWAFYPDFRIGVREGIERPDHNFIARPDAPVEFLAKNNKTPFELLPGRWFPESGVGWLTPSPSLFFQAGRRNEALHVALEKSGIGLMAIHKTEPRFEERLDGIMVEAFLSGDVISPVGDGTGMGFSIEDGAQLYQVMMVENPQRSYYGITKDLANLSAETGYHSPTVDADIQSLKLVRLTIDRLRPASLGGGKAQLYVDEELVLTKDLSTDIFPPASASMGMIRFGHLGLNAAESRIKISRLSYLPRYLAWEGADALTPDNVGVDTRVKFSTDITGLGSHVMVGSDLELSKATVGGVSKYLLTKDQPFAEVDGQQIDFKMKIDTFADFGGQAFPVNTSTGVVLTVHLGNKKVEIGFYDCGSFGRHVAILPSSGLESDIVNQTEIGRPLSALVDWTEMTQYRLVIKGHDRIELIVGSPISPPAITIPWRNDTDGFDLPTDVSTPRLTFGHGRGDTSSVSLWRYVRWGLSNGFEAAVQQEYPDGYPKYLFGGRAFIKSEFDEAP